MSTVKHETKRNRKTKIATLATIIMMGITLAPSTSAAETTSQRATQHTITQTSGKTNLSRTSDIDAPPCRQWLVRVLHETGFRGDNLRQAWAIVMRESGGREDAISATGDYGMFQLNRGAHGGQDWWDSKKLLTRDYNARIAYRMSQGGKNWSAWDISGDGRHLGNYSPRSVYEKYREWYNKYPCK